eukprot:scaffold17205_cov78-Skeletonema_dohrnii-CCMP3373.AAC.1
MSDPSSWTADGGDGHEQYYLRHLQEANNTNAPTSSPTVQPGELWQMIYVGVVLLVMFALLISDKIGADMVMLAALTACMAGQIITVQQGVAGFANVAVLTVMVSSLGHVFAF